MPEGAPATVLVCDACGKRLKAAGAVPGRLGRCPRCGSMFRVPAAAPSPDPIPISPTPDGESDPESTVAGGYGLGPPPEVMTPTFVTSQVAPTAAPDDGGRVWGGLIRRPSTPEARLRESLLYPLWDGNGVALLILAPPVLWVTSLPVLGVLPLLFEGGGGLILVWGAFAFPMVALMALLVGYVLLFLGRVLLSSALGEVRHPRLPEWDFGEILTGLGRWLWAALVGLAVGGLPATAYWISCGDIDLLDRVVLAELLALGAASFQMALMASLLHEDVRAANPITVVQAIGRVGWAYVRPCLLSGAAALLALGAFSAAWYADTPGRAALGLWAFWAFALYEAMVVLRAMGLFYRRHAARLGWFPERPRW